MSKPNPTTDAPNKPIAEKPADKPSGQPPKPGAENKPGAGEPPRTFTQEELDAAIERTRKADSDAAKQKEADAKLTEDERLKQRAENAETALRTREARDVVERAAKDAGAANTAKIYRLYKDEIEFDDKGKPSNLKELIATAKREYPEEFGKRSGGSADGGEGRGTGGAAKGSMNDIIRRASGRH